MIEDVKGTQPTKYYSKGVEGDEKVCCNYKIISCKTFCKR